MNRLTLNKNTLNSKRQKVKLLERFLPALELKRKQVFLEHKKARSALEDLSVQIELVNQDIETQLPMLNWYMPNLQDVLKIEKVNLANKNIAGEIITVFISADISVKSYGFLTKPFWFEYLLTKMQEMLQLKIAYSVQEGTCKILSKAVLKTTQRVNLFSKVLIPSVNADIQKIKIFLSDMERAAVINTKLSKVRAKFN